MPVGDGRKVGIAIMLPGYPGTTRPFEVERQKPSVLCFIGQPANDFACAALVFRWATSIEILLIEQRPKIATLAVASLV